MIPTTGKPHLGDTLKELNSAIEDWDKITNKPEEEQAVSRDDLQSRTKELLLQLRDQIEHLSADEPEEAEKPSPPPEG